MKNKKPFNNQFATLFLREEIEENSVTGGGEAYLPGLDVPEKKYKGPKENEIHDGYKKVKGFRPGHTKDTGGFQYKDLWNVNEEQFKETIATKDKDQVYKLLDLIKDKDYKLYKKFLTWISDIFPHSYEEFRMAASGLAEGVGDEKFRVGDEVKVVKQGTIYSNKIGEVIDVAPSGNFYTLQFKNGEKASYHESDLEGRDVKRGPKGPQMILSLDEEGAEDQVALTDFIDYKKTLNSAYTDLYRYGAENEKSAVGAAYDAVTNKDPKAIELLDVAYSAINNNKRIDQSNKFRYLQAIDNIKKYLSQSLNESYSKFRNETKTRTKAQQMHEAMKLAEKKINEANKILEYTSQLKSELFEGDMDASYNHHTKRLMEKISNRVVEAYTKVKKLK